MSVACDPVIDQVLWLFQQRGDSAYGGEAVCGLAWEDPLPFLRGRLWPAVWRRATGPAVRVARRADLDRVGSTEP